MSDIEARLAALEAEVRHLRDREAICQIISRYGPLADTTNSEDRFAKAAAFFGEDGIYETVGGVFNGPDFIDQRLRHHPHQGYVENGSTHVMAMPYVLVEGDRATAVGYSHVFVNQHDGSFKCVRGSANYWEFERRGGEWKVVRRRNELMDGTERPRTLLHYVDHTTPAPP